MLLSLFSFGMAYDTPFGRTLDGKEISYKKAMKDGWSSAVRQGKGFGAVGAAYSVSECIIESVSGMRWFARMHVCPNCSAAQPPRICSCGFLPPPLLLPGSLHSSLVPLPIHSTVPRQARPDISDGRRLPRGRPPRTEERDEVDVVGRNQLCRVFVGDRALLDSEADSGRRLWLLCRLRVVSPPKERTRASLLYPMHAWTPVFSPPVVTCRPVVVSIRPASTCCSSVTTGLFQSNTITLHKSQTEGGSSHADIRRTVSESNSIARSYL